MSEKQLAKNIVYYRRKKGLSQEKVSEYMGVSRQAVTKWENDISRPSSDNLIKLAQLFEVSVDTLLENDNGEEKNPAVSAKISMGRMPWIFTGISVLSMLAYIINSALSDDLSVGTLICIFMLCVPIQMFLNIYFSNAIRNDSFSGIAGFDNKIKYNICEVKKMLVQINLHIGIMSTVYVFLFCVINIADLEIKWLNGFLIIVYLFNFVTTVEMINYKMSDRIYRDDNDKKRAKRSMPVTVIYILLLLAGIGMICLIFEIKAIENNTLSAMKICGLLILAILAATAGFILENNRIKKWNPDGISHKTNKVSVLSLFICVILYGLMCIV